MLPADALSSMKVMVAVPCYGSATTSPCTASLFTLAGDCARLGLNVQLELRSESAITRLRNTMVGQFLQNEDYSHLCFIDADLQFSTEAVMRLLLADRDVVAGIYPLKQFNWPPGGHMPPGMTQAEFENCYASYPFFPIDDHADPDGFCEVYATTTGFMCIKRHVIEDMIEKHPEWNYTPDNLPPATRSPYHWAIFENMIDPQSRRYLTEDYAFCWRWRKMGGKIYADTQSQLNHMGQHVFKGDLTAKLRG